VGSRAAQRGGGCGRGSTSNPCYIMMQSRTGGEGEVHGLLRVGDRDFEALTED